MGFLSIQSIIPPGTVLPFAGSVAPAGWALCNGNAISRTTFNALFSAISTTYGVGDGSTTFNLPNAQGVFLRGAGSQTISAIAYSGTRGTTQTDQLQGHWHDNNYGFRANNSAMNSIGSGADQYFFEGSDNNNASTRTLVRSPRSDTVNGSPRSGSQTHPANISVNYIIKL